MPGYNFINGTTNPADDHGHGTSVSGTATAEGNNSLGVAGVAWNTAIMPLKAANENGSATYSNLAKAIIYAADRGARLINISMAGSSASVTLQDGVNYAWNRNCVIIAAAGNAGTEAPMYPAACQNVVAVSSTTSADAKSSFSSFGAHIDVAAPGSSICTTLIGSTYGAKSGTSFASPVTAGVAALMLSHDPALSNLRLVETLCSSADDLGAAGFDATFGHGRVNAHRALVQLGAPVNDTTAPVVSLSSPIAGSVVSGAVLIDASAIDDVGVTRIDLYLDGEIAASADTSRATFEWNSTNGADGWHVLQARAYDAAGNEGRSVEVSVCVDNGPPDEIAPTVAITSPSPGTKINGQLRVTIAANDNRAVSHAELYVDGAFVERITDLAAGFRVNTNKWTKGAHQLQAIACDLAGNAGVSPIVEVVK